MTVYSEETLPIPVGLGIDSYNHPANIVDGFCTSVKNFVANKDRLITRKGFQPPNSVDTRGSYPDIGLNNRYTQLPNSSDASIPVAMWTACNPSNFSTTWALRQFDRDNPASSDSNPGLASFANISNFAGACLYLDKFYCLDSGGVEILSNWNWALGTVTKVAVPNTYNCRGGLFVFKDRLWSWDDTKIYYTLPPNAPGAYPESWDMNGQFIVIGANAGLGKIQKVIPVGTKLFVFTGSGLYNISILGSPENWVVRSMDASVKVNHANCAIEDKGLIYFIDSRGVWVTNQDEVKDISDKIQDIFQEQLPNVYFMWKMVPFAEGIIICRTKLLVSGANHITSEARMFYTRLDFIAWTEITFGTTTQPGDLLAGFSNLETHVKWAPNNYIVIAHGNSTNPIFNNLTTQLFIYDGYQDKLTKLAASEEVSPVKSTYTSKIIRGQMLDEKRGKYGYINFSASGNPGDDIDIDYQWDTEQEVARQVDNISTYDVISAKEGLIKIKGPEFFRHLQFNLATTLSSAIDEYSILGSALVLHTHRKTPRTDS